jgi:hypothetical protein
MHFRSLPALMLRSAVAFDGASRSTISAFYARLDALWAASTALAAILRDAAPIARQDARKRACVGPLLRMRSECIAPPLTDMPAVTA